MTAETRSGEGRGRRRRWLRLAAPLISVLFFLGALWVLERALRGHRYHDILAGIRQIPGPALLAAAGLTVLSYLLLTGYDFISTRYAGRPLPWRRTALASFVGYAFSMNMGLPLLSGTPVRYRLYSSWGLSAAQVAEVVAFNAVTFWLGFLCVGGLAFLLAPMPAPESLPLPFDSLRPLGGLLLAVAAAYVVLGALWRRPLRLRSWQLDPPSFRTCVAQLVLSSADWSVAAGVLFVLLPQGGRPHYLAFLGVFVLAQIAGLASQVPAGLGVVESVLLLLLVPPLRPSEVLASLLAYRVIYYLLPLILSVLLLARHEVREGRARLVALGLSVGRWAQALVPHAFALATFVSGVILLFSGATPAIQGRLAWLDRLLPLPVIELSHFLGSVTGVLLLFLAHGLQRRLDAAFHLTAALLAAGIVLSLLKGLDYEEAAILAAMLAALAPCRREFYRRASLLHERLSPGWAAAVFLVILASVWLGLFSHRHVAYSGDLWWQFALEEGDAPRFLRATVGVVMAALLLAVAGLMRPALPEPRPPGPGELDRAWDVVRRSPRTYANLALLGDKSLLFGPGGEAFLMYGVEGRSWVALGDPVGPERGWRDLVWQFREMSDRHGGWTVFYQVDAESLPLYLDLGLSPLKIGEEGRVPLAGFSLDGGSRKGLRHILNKLEKEGLSLEIVPAERVPRILGSLREVSDAWLASKQAREKGFSLGFFEPGYLARFPAAIVRGEGRILAFADLWETAGKEELSIDLMRHLPEAPAGVMDYLFTRLMLWGRDEGYRSFNLGMTPLAGLEERALAPLWSRLGAFVYRHGEHFYNFQGLRQYKEKFDPEWRPKYLASPARLALPRIVANVASLIGGGMRGIVGK